MPKPGLRPTKAASNQGLSTAALTELVGSAVISRMPVNFFSQLIVVGFILCAYQVHTADFKPAAQDSIVSKGAKVEFLWGEGEFTEGPTLGPNGVIYFSDIGNRTLKFNPRTKKTTVFRADSGKSNGLMMDRKGNLIACEGANGGRRRISVTSSSGKTRVLADRWKGKRFNSPNDLAIDTKGRVYFTDPRYVGDEPRLLDEVVRRLVDGQVIGWFQGRAEWGPRALGNRSILADPRRADMKDIVNEHIKFREPFRPFAPSVLAERAEEFFDLDDAQGSLPARFMLLVVPVRAAARDIIPAVDHLGTARPQLVHADTNPLFHELIKRFGDATGVPVLLNTSYNVRGEPIVNSPSDALRTFEVSGLDATVLGHFIVSKRERPR